MDISKVKEPRIDDRSHQRIGQQTAALERQNRLTMRDHTTTHRLRREDFSGDLTSTATYPPDTTHTDMIEAMSSGEEWSTSMLSTSMSTRRRRPQSSML